MKQLQHIAFVWSFLLFGLGAQAQIVFKAKANKYRVGLHENFTIEFKINEQASNFQAPDLSDFAIISGPNPSQMSSISNVGGRMERLYSLSYNYYLRPKKVGTFTIGPAYIKAAGDTYSSSPITIEVVEQAAPEPDADNPRAQAKSNSFIRAQADRTTVYEGEPVVLSYKLYTRTQVTDVEMIGESDYSGFYKEVVDRNAKFTQSEERYGNVDYMTAVIHQTILIPQITGRNKMEPSTFRYRTVVQSNRRDFFGRLSAQYVPVQDEVQIPAIQVKALPKRGKPSNFSGAVGQYKLDVSLSKTELNADESLSLRIRISGNGNVRLADLPEPEIPSAFEAFDPKTEEDIKVGFGGMSGSKTAEYLLIPRYGGTYKIPEIEFSFFNPKTGRYETLRSKAYEVTVKGGTAMPAEGTVVAKEKEGVQFLGKEILDIQRDGGSWKKAGKSWFPSATFNWIFGALLALWLALVAYGIYRANRVVDRVAERRSKASKLARKQLSAAKREMQAGKADAFYEALAQALWGFIGHKLNLGNAALDKETIAQKLRENGIEEELIERYLMLLQNAEMARYSTAGAGDIASDFEAGEKLLTQLDKRL